MAYFSITSAFQIKVFTVHSQRKKQFVPRWGFVYTEMYAISVLIPEREDSDLTKN